MRVNENAFQLQYETICDRCDSVMGVGEWAVMRASGEIRHNNQCPKQPLPCAECHLQHNGSCW